MTVSQRWDTVSEVESFKCLWFFVPNNGGFNDQKRG